MIETRVNLGAFTRVLNAMRRPDLRPAWKDSKQPIRADIASHRAQQRGPDGAWAPRSSSTRTRSASKRKSRPRAMLGKLPTSVTTKIDRRRLAIVSRVPWSDVQQKGGTVGHGAKLPPRPFLWASRTALEVIAGIVSRHLAKLWKRAR